jgi:hypothetical protein
MQTIGVPKSYVTVQHPEIGARSGFAEWPSQIDKEREAGNSDVNGRFLSIAHY